MFIRIVDAGGTGDADNPSSLQPRGNAVGLLHYNGLTDFAGVYYAQDEARVLFPGIPLEAASGASSAVRDTLIARINHYFDGTLSAPDLPTVSLPVAMKLSEAFPNPFNPTTTAQLSLPTSSRVKATVYDLSGREFQRVFAGSMNAGTHSFTIDISHETSGVYFLRVEASGAVSTRKLALLK